MAGRYEGGKINEDITPQSVSVGERYYMEVSRFRLVDWINGFGGGSIVGAADDEKEILYLFPLSL